MEDDEVEVKIRVVGIWRRRLTIPFMLMSPLDLSKRLSHEDPVGLTTTSLWKGLVKHRLHFCFTSLREGG